MKKPNPRSSKAKGRRLQNLVRDLLKKAFPSLHDDDIKSQIMGVTGEDIVLSPHAQKKIPYSFECKNVERLNIWNAIDQAESNSKKRTPVVVFKKNNKQPYVIMNLKQWLKLIK